MIGDIHSGLEAATTFILDCPFGKVCSKHTVSRLIVFLYRNVAVMHSLQQSITGR